MTVLISAMMCIFEECMIDAVSAGDTAQRVQDAVEVVKNEGANETVGKLKKN